MRIYFIMLSLLVLSACASTPRSDQIAQNWQGKSVNELMQSWGQPNATHVAANGHAIYVYTSKTMQQFTPPMTSNTTTIIGPGGQAISANIPPASLSMGPKVLECVTQFKVNKQGIIESIQSDC